MLDFLDRNVLALLPAFRQYFFKPHLPFEPNTGVLYDKQPTFIIGDALHYLDQEIDECIRDIVLHIPTMRISSLLINRL
jgi:hypothetical protein